MYLPFTLTLFFQHSVQKFIFFPENYLEEPEAVWTLRNCPLAGWCTPMAVNVQGEVALASGKDVK